MTEVPEYLLERSRARRAALGLPGGGAPPAAAGEGAPSAAAPAASAPAPAVPEAAAAVAAAPEPSGGVATATAPAPTIGVDAGPRSGIPTWMMPVLLILPFWAIIYMGAFAEPEAAAGPRSGAQIYASAGCGSCHGPTGGGGVGPKLAGGEAKLTFPNEADHVAWVENGSGPSRGKSYGDPARPGGPRPSASGGMPSYKGQLTPEEILAVVQYERDRL